MEEIRTNGHGKRVESQKAADVLPTPLQRKLADIYINLSDETKADLAEVKKALMKKAGFIKDS